MGQRISHETAGSKVTNSQWGPQPRVWLQLRRVPDPELVAYTVSSPIRRYLQTLKHIAFIDYVGSQGTGSAGGRAARPAFESQFICSDNLRS